MRTRRLFELAAAALVALAFQGCATETSHAVATPQVQAAMVPYSGPKHVIAVGKFENRSEFLRGIFSDGIDRLGGQAKTILITHLQQSGRFSVMDRENLEEIKREASFSGAEQKIKGAEFAVTGDVTAFGRKETGDTQLFGVLGQGKSQVAYAKVSIYIVDVATSEVITSVQGAGEYALDNREVLGFGGTASYDSTLNGKVLDLAIREAVDKLVVGMERGDWQLSR
ncbi:MAG TPA: CsgG/HfaB family protein [Opitutaceae bacterium]|nr:CsgG/HfaB family protein [Opitutaceae bacterium]